MDATAHRIDNDLYQYWVTITPLDTGSGLATISASAYIHLRENYRPAALSDIRQGADPARNSPLISTFAIVRLNGVSQCDGAGGTGRFVYEGLHVKRQGERCYALQTETQQDSVVFFLHNQLNNGMVRLADHHCSQRSDAHIARHGEPLQFPLAIDATESPSWSPGNGHGFDPEEDTFYAVASSNTKAARALARHFERLPERCGYSVRPGLEGDELRLWFDQFEAIARHWQSEVDWQSVQVRNVL